MCDECRRKWDAWLDYRPPLPAHLEIGPPTPSRMQRIAMVRQQLVKDRLDLIRSQQNLIRDICLRKHQLDQAA